MHTISQPGSQIHIMFSHLGVLALGLLLLWLIHYVLVASHILSPLSRLPAAHWSAHISSRWLRQACAQDGELNTLYTAHRKSGPIIRLAPGEVSVVSQEGLRKVYVGGLDKSSWYEQTFRVYGMPNLVCTLDHKTHSSVRRLIAGSYTKTYLQHAEDLRALSHRIVLERLLPDLSKRASSASDTNVMELFECMAVDFATGHLFGNTVGTDLLVSEDHRRPYVDEWRRVGGSSADAGRPLTEALILEKCRLASRICEEDQCRQEEQETVFAKLLRGLCDKAEQGGLNASEVITRCASEVADHVIASQETVSIIWTYIFYRLSQHPDVQELLRAELRSLESFNSSDKHDILLPEPASIERLPVLDAVVTETLRLHAANPARMRRVVPSAGLSLHGYFLPPKTIVSSNAYCLHRNEDVFAVPFEWHPGRWLSSASMETKCSHASDLHRMRKWLWAFGSGPRGCIGQYFAIQSMIHSTPLFLSCRLTSRSHKACGGSNILPVHHEAY